MKFFTQHTYPTGLFSIAWTEVCDRAVYYGVQSMLILYLIQHIGCSNPAAIQLYAVYSTLAFGLPLIGGWLGDHLWGHFRSVVMGGIMIIIACILALFNSLPTLLIGLACLSMAIGFLKPNAVSQAGQLYPRISAAKETGMTIFYMGMNLGAMLGPIVFSVFIAEHHWLGGFGVIIFAMTLALLAIFRRRQALEAVAPKPIPNQRLPKWVSHWPGMIAFAAILTSSCWLAMIAPNQFSKVVLIAALTIIVLLIWLIAVQTRLIRLELIGIIFCIGFMVIFAICEIQLGSSVILFTAHYLPNHFYDIPMPPELVASIEPLSVLLMMPFFAPIWSHLTRKHPYEPIFLYRILTGILLCAIGFLIFDLAVYLAANSKTVMATGNIILGSILVGAGELCLGPAIIIAITNLVPKSLQATFMGVMFLAIAMANLLGGYLNIWTVAKHIHHHIPSLTGLNEIFLLVAVITFASLLSAVLLVPFMRYLINQRVAH